MVLLRADMLSTETIPLMMLMTLPEQSALPVG
jgi:hypothetical protein